MPTCKVKYVPDLHYKTVKQRLLAGISRGFDYESWIRDNFSNADELISAVSKLIGKTPEDLNNAIAVLKGQTKEIEGAFGPRFLTDRTLEESETIEVDSVPIGERREEGLNIRSAFITESTSSDPTQQYTNAINAFVKDVVETVIYDPTKKKMWDPNFEKDGHTRLNRELYRKRIELITKIWNKLHPDTVFSYEYTTENDFTALINRVLAEYANKRIKLDPNGEVFADYMILKNFDAIISTEFKNVIAPKRTFQNNQKIGRDMYEFLGGRVEHDTTWGDEFADASDYSGKLVKIMLNYFKGKVERNGKWVDTEKSIGFPAFCNLMSRVKEWAENKLSNTHLNIVHGDVNSDWAWLVNEFLKENKSSLTDDEINALNGIRISLLDNSNPKLKEMFVNQAKKTVRYRYLVVKPAYNRQTGRMEMKTTLMEDNLVDRQNVNIQKSVKNAVLRLRSSQTAKDNLKASFNYEVTKNSITIYGLGDEPVVINYESKKSSNGRTYWEFTPTPSINGVENDKAAQLIRLVIGQPIPNDINSYMKQFPSYANLLSVFVKPIALTLLAADPVLTKEVSEDAEITFSDGIVNTYGYYDIFYPSALLMNSIFGTSDTNVVRNEEGNALPSYQIISSIFNVKEWIHRTKSEQCALRSGIDYTDYRGNEVDSDNILFRDHNEYHRDVQYQPIGAIFTRGDITKDGITKSSNQLTTKEVFHVEFMENFYKRAKDKKSLILQPVTFSDKKTHFLIEYMTDQMYVDDVDGNGEKLSETVANLISTDENTRALGKLRIENEIRYGRGRRALRQLVNIFTRFKRQLGLSYKEPSMNMSYAEVIANINTINEALKRYNIASLRATFNKVDLEEALDIKQHSDGTLEFNPILRLEADLYLNPNKSMWNKYLEQRVKASAKNLLKIGYEFDSVQDASVSDLIRTWRSSLDSGWFDDNARTMKAVRVFDAAGNELELYNDAEIDAAFNQPGVRVELHPVLEGYMLSDQLLSQSFTELLAGSTNAFTGKLDLPALNDTMTDDKKLEAYTRYVASNLSDEFKRTVLAGAIKTPYAQGKKYGVSSKWKIAVISDQKANMYNYSGLDYSDKAQDGAGYVSPYVSKQENESLREAAVGEGIKKTFLNYKDPETGVLREIKWAEFTVTNRDRRSSRAVERQFQLMHNLVIPASKLQGIDISQFYNLDGDITYDDDRRLTHITELYYKSRTDNGIIYYKINSVKSEFKNGQLEVTIDQDIVDKNGNFVAAANPKIVYVKSIADLDAIFGGAYCMEKDNKEGTLVYSTANNDIVNNIICNHDLKDHMIAFTVNTSAQKVGHVNVNPSDSFDGAVDQLKYFEMESRYAGVQMNADHELDEAEVSEMTQMMAALIQSGYGSGVVDKIYTLIGRIAEKNIRKYTKVLNSGNDKQIYIKLGKLFAESFLRNDRDMIGLAESFVIAAAKELNVGLDDTKIPFSSNQIKGIFQSTITSTFNKLGIRRKFPGVGAINSPAFGRIHTYSFNGETLSYDEIQDRIVYDLRERKLNGTISSSWTVDNVFTRQSSNGRIIDNPYMIPIASQEQLATDISFEDTVVIKKKGDIGDGEVIRIKDINTLDRVINFTDLNEYNIYKWTNQPRELRQPIDTVEMVDQNGKSLRIRWTDLDSVRASFYIAYFDPSDENIDAKIEVINKVLARGPVKIKINRDSSENDLKTALLWAQNVTKQFVEAISDGAHTDTVPVPETYKNSGFSSGVTFRNHQKARGQVIMGITNAKVLDIPKGTKLADIMSQQSTFFANRLVNKYQKPLDSEYSRKKYDAILYRPDGKPIFVVMGNVSTNLDRLDGCIPSQQYIINSDGNIEYNGEELFESGGKAFFTTPDGKYDILVVDDAAAFKDVIDAKQHTLLRYNYTPDNWQKLVEFQYPKNFKNGVLIKPFTINGITITDKVLSDPSVAINLDRNEDLNFVNNTIPNLALRQWNAFKAQLTYILARIPSQSMQSFMDVDVTLLTDSELNEVYVPRALAFIQGSDYDIDKDYMMGFGLLPDGTLPTLSDLENEIDPNTGYEYNPSDILSLRAPEGRTFIQRTITPGRKGAITQEDVDSIKRDIKNLNRILTLPKSGPDQTIVYFAQGIDSDDRKWIIDLCNKHEQSKRSGNRELLGLQNTVVKGILDILGRPDVQINMNNPISMDELKGVAKKTKLAKDEQTMSLDDLVVKFKMQEQNMIGREVIGIGAVSLKHFFTASTFFNHQLNEACDDIENYERTGLIDESQLVQNILDLCFDHKWDSHIITLANLNFRRLKDLLQKNPKLQDIILKEDLSVKYSESGKRGLFEERLDKNDNILSPFIEIVDGNSVIHLQELVKHLDLQSNGAWDSPVDAAFALSQLISAATDNAKELILAKINATTKFADVWTYLMTTGMRISEIAKIMTSPMFNVIAYYAQSNIYDKASKSITLEDAIKFVLNKQTLYRGINSKFNTLLTFVGKGTGYDDLSQSFLLRLCCETTSDGTPILLSEKPNNALRRWFELYKLPEGDNIRNVDLNTIITAVRNTVKNRWNEDKFTFTDDYNNLIQFIYSELETNPEAQQLLLTMLSEHIGGNPYYEPFDPDMILFQDDSYLSDPDMLSEFAEEDEDDGLADYNGNLDSNSARTFYRYFKNIWIPKTKKIAGISDRETMEVLLEKVLPAMKEQQIHGQILGVNQGIKAKGYDEWNWVRKIDNFVNQRYIQSKDLDAPEEFTFLRFLTDKAYQDRQIAQYEKVKSSINILKSILKVPNYTAMLQIVKDNRYAIERAAAIRIEHDVADRVLAANKSIAKKKTNTGVSTGYFFKLNPKEYKAIQYAVSDSLIFNFLTSLKGLRLKVPIGQSYYVVADGQIKDAVSTKIKQHNIEFKNIHDIASFKRLMDDYIIPELVRTMGSENEFLANLTTGFKRDSVTGLPITFYKLSFDISQIEKSPKLDSLYSNVARDFNKLLYMEADPSIAEGWKIGDLFYLYNLIAHKEAIGGDSFTKIFDELAANGNRFSLLSAYRNFLGRLDNGDLRWSEATVDDAGLIHYGDAVTIDLRDMRYRACLSEESQKKTRVLLDTDKNGKVVKVKMTDAKNKPTGESDSVDLTSIPRSDYTLGLPFITKVYTSTSKNTIDLGSNTPVTMNSAEVLSAIVNAIKIRVPNIPIHIITDDDLLDDDWRPFEWDDRMASAVGFMVDGHIYINPDHFKAENGDLGAPVHELMHIFCAAMKYGNTDQRTLYYKLLDGIGKADPKWSAYYEDMADDYNVVGSDLKEEILVRAMTKAFLSEFENEWTSSVGVDQSNLDRVVRNIISDVLAVQFEGTVPINQILQAPLEQVLGIFNSQFIGSPSRRVISTIIPTNQRLAKLKIQLVNDETLKIGDDC